MAQLPIRDALADLERHRLRLEDNLEKLRAALRHWQTWEVEYDGLKEEIQALPPHASTADLLEAGKNFGGDLVSEKEVRELLGVGKGIERSSSQVIELLSRRIDYVQRNVESLQKQFDTAQLRLEGVKVVREPEARNEEGLPIQDIYEELDDDGNVIASRISHPDDVEPQILKVLQKAGLRGEDAGLGEFSRGSSRVETAAESDFETSQSQQPLHSDSIAASPIPESYQRPRLEPRKKSVSFADDTKADPSSASSVVGISSQANSVSEIAKGSFTSKDRVIELDDDDRPIASTTPAASIDESPEDAAIRRQMQAYSMLEVGEIVAQLDLEEQENDSQSSYDDDEDYGQYGFATGSDENADDMEDQYGMNAEGQLTEEYKQEMLALEKELNARMIQNVGRDPKLAGDDEVAADARRLVIQREKASTEANDANIKETGSREKAVRFAEKLDVAPTLERETFNEIHHDSARQGTPVKDVVRERNTPTRPTETQTPLASRFKMARQEPVPAQNFGENTVPHRSSSNPLATDIVERSSKSQVKPRNEFDPEAVRQEVNTEYYRQRNRIIQKQGGFKRNQQELDGGIESGDDENKAEAPAKKVSLFKAARAQAGGSW